MNDIPHIHGGSLAYVLPGYVRRDTALHVLNTTYVVFIGLIFSSLFYFTGGSDARILIVPMSLPFPALLFSLSIILYLILLWLCDNFYTAIPLHVPDMLLLGSLLRIALFGCCFIISLNDGPEKFLLFGVAAILESLVYYKLYTGFMEPLLSESAHKWRQSHIGDLDSSKVDSARMRLESYVISAIIIFAVRFCLAVGVIVFSLPLLIMGSKNGSELLWLILSGVGLYILTQFILWVLVFRTGLLDKDVQFFSEYEVYFHQEKRKVISNVTD